METLPSPVQSEGFTMSPTARTAPKIEITGTDPLCQTPLALGGCDAALCDRDDFHRHADGGCGVDDPAYRNGGQEVTDSRRGGSRRSEGGPGKCPSPARNSPRRHSPVPYSPKRHHSRTSASSVTSEELNDASLSPRRHSPVPILPQERPCSLPLASPTSEEFVCVSYTDPFSSPTITHTSDAFLAISIDCAEDVTHESDVEMTSYDHAADVTLKSHNPDTACVTDTGEVLPSKLPTKQQQSSHNYAKPRDFAKSKSVEQTEICSSGTCAVNDTDNSSVNMEGSLILSSSCVRNLPDCVEVLHKVVDATNTASTASVPFGSESETVSRRKNSEGSDTGTRVEHVHREAGPCSSNDSAVWETESMEGEEDVEECSHVVAYSSDSSSEDDDMAEMLLASQPSGLNTIPSFIPFPRPTTDIIPDTCVHNVSSTKNPAVSGSAHSDDHFGVEVDSAGTCSSTCDGGCGEEVGSPDGKCSLSVFSGSSAAWRRASFPFQQQGAGWRGDGSRTPEDFSLPRVVGYPPLHFPHGQGAVLVHCALPSPYDPHLPTPPIVLTPHTSYSDLSAATDGAGRFVDCRRPDIARSRSFPNLDHEQATFHEPHQAWPELGQPSTSSHHNGSKISNMADVDSTSMEAENSGCSGDGVDSGGGVGQTKTDGVCSTEDLAKASTSHSLPTSPTLNGRAAVIGRLRRVVERRLSGTMDDVP